MINMYSLRAGMVFLTLWLFVFPASLPTLAQSGIPIPQMAACDSLVNDFMTVHSVPSMTLTLAKDGKIVYNRGFGEADLLAQETMQPYHRFRIASISKPITSIAIMKLVEQQQLSLSDKVFGPGGLLGNNPDYPTQGLSDARVVDITVQHLLEHTAGWDRTVNCTSSPTAPYPFTINGCDPIEFPLAVSLADGSGNPASKEAMIRYLMAKGLNNAPGAVSSYSNIGFLILGVVIEEVTGQSYESYVRDVVFGPLGLCDLALGRNLLTDKLVREVEYHGNGGTTLSCYDPNVVVPFEYGGLNIEAMDAHGGWVATGKDLVRILTSVDGFSTKADLLSASSITTMVTPSSLDPNYAKGWYVNQFNNWWHTGSLPGTTTFFARTSNGYTWAVMIPYRRIGTGANQFLIDLDNLPWNCIANTSNFPSHDLGLVPTTGSSQLLTSPTSNTASLTWTPGDGSHRLVVARESGLPAEFPLEGQPYTANPQFGQGSSLGSDNYVVYNGSGSSVSVTGLQANTSYEFSIFEYQQSSSTGNHPLYLLCDSATASVSTLPLVSTASPAETFQVFPNPTPGRIRLVIPPSPGGATLQLFNPAGQLVVQEYTEEASREWEWTDLPAGIYFLHVAAGGQVWHRKIVLQSE